MRVDHRLQEDPLIARALEIVDQRLRPDLRLAEVAKEVSLSPSRLRHRIKERSGRHYREILQERLMARAARVLVSQPQRRILDLALEMGWKDPQAFHTASRRYYKVAPGRWRKEALTQKA